MFLVENSNNSNTKINMTFKIVISVVILCIIGGIWFVKNNTNEPAKVSNTNNAQNTDFALNVTEKIDLKKLKSYGLPIVIDFGSDSCIPCKQMAPVLKESNSELQGKAIIRFVDVWKNKSFADGYPVSIIPTQVFIDTEGNPYKPKDSNSMNLKLHKSDAGEHIFTTHEGGITKDELLAILKEMGLK